MIEPHELNVGLELIHGPTGRKVRVTQTLVQNAIGEEPCCKVRFVGGELEFPVELRILRLPA